jgi:D-glycero-D-manno-heptose 1,7-bisphosphate phosphatase
MMSGHTDEYCRAVFLDRDGTLTHPYRYPSQPEHLRLYDGVGPARARLQAQGFRLGVITNQSGLARGYCAEDDLARMHNSLIHELARWQVRLDAIYYCPHHIDGTIPALTRVCSCRKPQPGMLLQAASDLKTDLKRSWFVGDILDDVEAGNCAGRCGDRKDSYKYVAYHCNNYPTIQVLLTMCILWASGNRMS